MKTSQLGRYLSSAVLKATLASLVVILGLDLTFTMIDSLGDISNHYRFGDILLYMAMRLPERIYLFFPIAVLIGMLVGLGGLAATSELTVMRASGLSIPRLILLAMRPIAGLLLLLMIFSEGFMFNTIQFAETWRWEKINEQKASAHNVTQDLWLRDEQNFIRINVARDDGILLGITVYQLDDQWNLKRMITAPKAILDDQQQWRLQEAHDLVFSDEQVITHNLDQATLSLPVAPEFIALQTYDPPDLSAITLWHYAHYLDDKGLDSGYYWLAFWRKTLLPITIFSVVLLGASFTFGSTRSIPASTRIFHGIVIGLLLKFAQDLLGPATLLWGLTPALSVLLPSGLCILWALHLIRRAG